METSPLICGANQWTGFYTITASVMKELSELSLKCCKLLLNTDMILPSLVLYLEYLCANGSICLICVVFFIIIFIFIKVIKSYLKQTYLIFCTFFLEYVLKRHSCTGIFL